MLKLPRQFFLLITTFLFFSANAQEGCGTDLLHQYLMENDADYRLKHDEMELRMDALIASGAVSGHQRRSVYNVPVVVHVIHLGEPVGTGTNISDSQVIAGIQGLNDRFRNVIGSGSDMEINFCLATRDPNGCITNGINRVDGSSVPNYSANGISYVRDSCGGTLNELLVKGLSKWPVQSYYNIWVVNKICGGWYGYAYFPYGSWYDGMVIISSAMKYSAPTLTHEVGHGFNLMHTFEGDGGNKTCPVDTNCLKNGDKVCDTPPHKQGACGSTDSCLVTGDWNNSRWNYMSYCFPSAANCRFTAGQKDRMTAAMQTYPRNSLLSSLGCTPGNVNCTATGIADNQEPAFSVFPNPVHNHVNISGITTGREDVHITLTNIIGQEVISRLVKTENGLLNQTLSIEGLKPGIYLIQIETGGKRTVLKFNKTD